MSNTNGRMTPLEKMIRSSNYGKREMTDEQVAEAMAETGPMFDVNSRYPAEMTDEQVAAAMGTTIDDQRPGTLEGDEDDAGMVITEIKIPDYADIMRLENLAWSRPSGDLGYQEYAKAYHQLATEYTEDVLTDCIHQYYHGHKW